jgi:hypothetical protein
MDLLVLILILLSGYIIKYLIDTINSLNNEIREIKMKCVSPQNNVKFDSPITKTPLNNTTASTANTTAANATAANTTAANTTAVNAMNASLIKNITYFKDYFDNA